MIFFFEKSNNCFLAELEPKRTFEISLSSINLLCILVDNTYNKRMFQY